MTEFPDDGLLLNITTKPHPISKATKNSNKQAIKKEKYTKRFRGQSQNKKNKIPIEQFEEIKKPKGRKLDSLPVQQSIIKKPSISKDKRDVRMKKKNFQEHQIIAETQNIQVNQIMPEKGDASKYIDNYELDGFQLFPQLKNSLQQKGIEKLTEIQQLSFESISNERDSILKARTGSGKTLAYLVPLMNNYLRKKVITSRKDGITLMIICPTRQLCIQGQKELQRCLKRSPFIVGGCLMGGEDINHEKARLRKGINVLFGTPGKILYHLQNTKNFNLTNLKTIVFEEADRTLDMGFEETTKKIMNVLEQRIALSHIHKILVSAHFNSKVSSLIERLNMNDANFIGFVENQQKKMTVDELQRDKEEQINTSNQLKQHYVLISEEEKIPFMLSYIRLIKGTKILIFVSTIDEVQFLDCLFSNLKFRDSNGIRTEIPIEKRPIFKIHGNLDQKLRTNTYLQFRKLNEAIMISTEVASRGLDFPDLSHIILFDVPPSITDYGNRVGRSARFNHTGVSLLLLHYQESDYAEKIRYFCPDLQVLSRQTIYDNHNKILQQMNIGDRSLHYLEGLIRSFIKDDDEKYQVARKAYVSMLRAYSRLKDKEIFATKKLNLKMLARSFGLNSANAGDNYNPKAKVSQMEMERKKRKVESVKKLQFSEYM